MMTRAPFDLYADTQMFWVDNYDDRCRDMKVMADDIKVRILEILDCTEEDFFEGSWMVESQLCNLDDSEKQKLYEISQLDVKPKIDIIEKDPNDPEDYNEFIKWQGLNGDWTGRFRYDHFMEMEMMEMMGRGMRHHRGMMP